MKNTKTRFYSNTTNIGFWIMVIIASIIPTAITRLGIELYLTPQIEIALTFFLSIYGRTKAWQFFLYGLFIDIAYGTPIGISSLILLSLHHVIGKFKANLTKQNFGVILVYFIYSTLVIAILRYIIFSIYYSADIKIYSSTILINLMINILFYPILHLLLSNSIYFKNYENQQWITTQLSYYKALFCAFSKQTWDAFYSIA